MLYIVMFADEFKERCSGTGGGLFDENGYAIDNNFWTEFCEDNEFHDVEKNKE